MGVHEIWKCGYFIRRKKNESGTEIWMEIKAMNFESELFRISIDARVQALGELWSKYTSCILLGGEVFVSRFTRAFNLFRRQ